MSYLIFQEKKKNFRPRWQFPPDIEDKIAPHFSQRNYLKVYSVKRTKGNKEQTKYYATYTFIYFCIPTIIRATFCIKIVRIIMLILYMCTLENKKSDASYISTFFRLAKNSLHTFIIIGFFFQVTLSSSNLTMVLGFSPISYDLWQMNKNKGFLTQFISSKITTGLARSSMSNSIFIRGTS